MAVFETIIIYADAFRSTP